ncbi:lipase family protein [Acidisphaera sp. S103]|uniref:lipase family protein n=1 Tax=Acidisphaera sp. S103 TaxID=1747223 RepID=UPI00131E18EA|nr:hypothetical protein [Acidisphaera sp. S103]
MGTVVRTITHIWKHKAAAKTPAPEVATSRIPDADAQLKDIGWIPWTGFPNKTLQDRMIEQHLRAEVWEQKDRTLIVVAFGGTVFTSGSDWIANLRWFIPKRNDEYTQIVGLFGPDFVKEFRSRVNNPEMAYLKDAKIYSTGHSLGGGLAQQFAYALPKGIQRVSKVYAFDPSPVTGFYSVDCATRQTNRDGLQITRIYERGEILAILRSFTSILVKPSAIHPMIRGVRFNLFYTGNAISGHSIVELARKMQAAAGVAAWTPSVVHAPIQGRPAL